MLRWLVVSNKNINFSETKKKALLSAFLHFSVFVHLEMCYETLSFLSWCMDTCMDVQTWKSQTEYTVHVKLTAPMDSINKYLHCLCVSKRTD